MDMGTSYKLKPLLFLTLLCLSLSIDSVKGCHPDDERALLQIKKAFNNVSFFSEFIPGTNCCNWSQVNCKVFPDSPVPRVSFLSIFSSDEVAGEIPSAIAGLTYLQTLVLSSLPKLTGPIPNVFIHLKHIHTLELDNNTLTGSIPAYLGWIPTLGRINLQNNQLTGTIPARLGSLAPGFVLFLSNNHLTGSIPPSLGRVSFDILDLSGNQLTGDASFLFGEKPDWVIVELNLSHNKLSFDLSKVAPLGGSNISVSFLYLDHNMIYGQIPAWLGQAAELNTFDVSFNQLCGPIPTAGGKLQGFSASSFAHNKCLCGAPLSPCKS